MKLAIYTLQKTGTHLLSQAVACLIRGDMGPQDLYTRKLYDVVPHISSGKVLRKHQCFSTHADHVPYKDVRSIDGEYRFLNMIRNPLDVIISRYHFYVTYRGGGVSLQKYFAENILELCRDMVKHRSFIREVGGASFRFEDAVADRVSFLKSVAREIDVDAKDVMAKADLLDISNAQEVEKDHGTMKVGAIQDGPFYRDGTSGQYRKAFDGKFLSEAIQRLPCDVLDDLAEVGYDFRGLS